MLLIVQVRSLVLSLFLGWIFALVYSFYNRMVYHMKFWPVKFIFEVLIMVSFAYIYMMSNVKVNQGQISIYMILCLILGIVVFELYYAPYFLYCIEKIMRFFSFIFRPVLFIFNQICAIFIGIKKRVKLWQKRKKEKLIIQEYED